jgi:hypothetical protein
MEKVYNTISNKFISVKLGIYGLLDLGEINTWDFSHEAILKHIFKRISPCDN